MWGFEIDTVNRSGGRRGEFRFRDGSFAFNIYSRVLGTSIKVQGGGKGIA